MGHMSAIGMAEQDISLETAMLWHLGSNHYPPVTEMVPACIEAIELARERDWDALVELPEGCSYRGSSRAPVWAVVEAHHLAPWCEIDEDEGEDEFIDEGETT